MKAINLNKTNKDGKVVNKDELSLYYEFNETKKECEKQTKELKPVILELIEAGKGNNGEYEAIKTIREKKSIDEEKVLELIKEFIDSLKDLIKRNEGLGEPFLDKVGQYKNLKNLNIIKTKEYVDMEALEKAIYNNLIDPTILEPAQSIKLEVVLTVKKVK